MTNKQHPQVRLVRCPKCAKVLPEPEHVPLYTCGGCGTILQAKNYRGHQRNTVLSSYGQDVSRSNGVIHARDGGESSDSSRRSSSSGEHSAAQDEGRDQVPVEISRNSEQNGVAISLDSTLVSKESSLLKNKGNGEVHNCESDKSFCKSEQNNGSANSAQHTALSEESDFTGNKKNGEIDKEIDQSDTEDHTNDYPTVIENEEPVPRAVANSRKEDDYGNDERCNGIAVENHLDEDDQLECKLKGYVNSAKDSSSLLSESPALESPEEHHASDHNVTEEPRKMDLVGKHSRKDQHEQNQVTCVNSAEDASSWTDSLSIEKPTQFASENAAEHDASDQQLPLPCETRNFYLAGKHSHRDNSGNEVKRLDADKPEVEISCKEYGNGTDPIEQVGRSNSAKKASSLIESLEIKTSDRELSEETSEMLVVEEHLHHVSQNEIHHLNSDKPEEVEEKPGKKNDNKTDPNDFVERMAEQLESVKLSLSTQATQDVNEDDSVPGTEDSSEAFGRDRASKDSSAEDLETSHETGIAKGSMDPHCGRSSLDNVKEASEQNIENFGGNAVYIESDVGSLLKEFPGSPTKRSPAYDGSVSSCDDNDDKVPEHSPQIGEETLSSSNAVAGYDGAEESPEWVDNIPSERRYNRNCRVQTHAKSSSSMLLDKKLKSSMIKEEGNGIAGGNNRYRPNRDNFLPRVPNRRVSSEMTYETGSCSSYALHDEPASHQMHHHHPYRRRFPEAPFWREKEFLPMYYNSETSGEIYDRPNYHAYTDRRRRAESWSQSGTLPPRMPYSGELFSGRYSYMHRYPDNRRWSAQLPPPPAVYYHQGVHVGPSWETRWDPYDSYPTSPPRFVESDSSCAWGHDVISLSDDQTQRHKDQIMRRLYLREKRQAVKKQFHPIAGGTPFITCYFCFNILQLPQNFLLSRRRKPHKLKCGACSRVLEFSFENEGCFAPCETNIDRNVNLAVKSLANHSRHSSLNSADGRELLSQDSFGASAREKGKLVPGNSSNRETTEGTHDDEDEPPARGRPPKVTWQLPARSKSPLHRLMGYSSPKDLLIGHEADDVE